MARCGPNIKSVLKLAKEQYRKLYHLRRAVSCRPSYGNHHGLRNAALTDPRPHARPTSGASMKPLSA
eukprot:scaffold14199_cov183-Amphora_coffeaeformis.AAC.2